MDFIIVTSNNAFKFRQITILADDLRLKSRTLCVSRNERSKKNSSIQAQQVFVFKRANKTKYCLRSCTYSLIFYISTVSIYYYIGRTSFFILPRMLLLVLLLLILSRQRLGALLQFPFGTSKGEQFHFCFFILILCDGNSNVK